MDQWAKVIQHFLKPDGEFVMADFHPFVWMYDDGVTYHYFNKEEIVENYEGTYAKFDAPLSQQYVMWNHPLYEISQSLISNNLDLKQF